MNTHSLSDIEVAKVRQIYDKYNKSIILTHDPNYQSKRTNDSNRQSKRTIQITHDPNYQSKRTNDPNCQSKRTNDPNCQSKITITMTSRRTRK